ncbi:MAG: TlpA family protein disulfide reductase, partial [Methyloligellaceae bacterium]
GLNKGELAAFVIHKAPRDIADVTFVDRSNRSLKLTEWKGKIVLLNLWATWCAPCRKEMPGLDALQAQLGGDQFDVVALSIDRDGLEKAGKFLKKISVKSLALYNDGTAKAGVKLKAFGMPTTLLLNRQGEEIGRLTGPAEWHSEDAVRLIEAAIAKTSS